MTIIVKPPRYNYRGLSISRYTIISICCPSPLSTSQVPHDAVDVNKKFTFCFHTAIVLWCERFSGKDMKLLLYWCLAHCIYDFRCSETFECLYKMQPVSNAVLPGLHVCVRPWIPLPASICSVSMAFAEPETERQCD